MQVNFIETKDGSLVQAKRNLIFFEWYGTQWVLDWGKGSFLYPTIHRLTVGAIFVLRKESLISSTAQRT